MKFRQTAINRRKFTRAAALCLLALAATLIQSREAHAQWTTSGNNISSTNTGNVGVGTASPDTNAKLHVYNAPSAGVDVQSADSGGWSRLRLVTGTHAYGWFTGDSSQPDAANKIGLYDYTVNAFRMMVDSSGNFGIGTSSPVGRLDVRQVSNSGQLATFLSSSGANEDTFVRGGSGSATVHIGDLTATTSKLLLMENGGNVGIGTTSPGTRLDVGVGAAPRGGYSDVLIGPGGNNAQLEFYGPTKSSAITHDEAMGGMIFYTNGPSWGPSMMVSDAGNVGIGTTAPAAKLDVQGDIRVSGNINAKYQDVAEWVPSAQKLAPGTVVILDAARDNHVMASLKAYDTRVAGVVSAQPGLTLGEAGEGKALVATTGRVKVRVDASRGAIHVGDLLVTGDRAGYAMRSEPLLIGGREFHSPGTIIGKALQPLAGGTGEILVLLSLQ
jgi:hypothetical protein